MPEQRKISTFDTGATRDSDHDKPDYHGFFSVPVMRVYGGYMHHHRKQSNGSLRASDNWKKGIPLPRYMKSLWRHFLDLSELAEGGHPRDFVDGHEITVQEAACGVLFNTQGFLHEWLKGHCVDGPMDSTAPHPPLISIDLDGCLYRFTLVFSQFANKVLGRYISVNPSGWDWPGELDRSETGAVWDAIKATENFWCMVPPYQDNIECLRGYLDSHPDQKVVFLTSRIETAGSDARTQTENVLRVNGLYPRNGQTSVAIEKARKKAKFIEQSGIAFSLDDKPETVEACSAIPGHKAFLLDRTWNHDYKPWSCQSGIHRVNSMAEFLSMVEEYKMLGKVVQ